MERLLIHACCAPCLSYPLELLVGEFNITAFYSNSNIYPKTEYDKRLGELKKLTSIYKVPLIIDGYRHDEWLMRVRGLEQELEGRKRCLVCFYYRLERLFFKAKELNIHLVTASLTVSPYKKSKFIFNIARGLMKKFPEIKYLEYDFKKKDGYKKSIELSKKYSLYRQHYCGCEFS